MIIFFAHPDFFLLFPRSLDPGKLRKRQLKSVIALLKLLIALIPSHTIRQMLVNLFLELNSKELYQSSGKEKEGRRFEFVFTSSMKPYNLILRRSCATKALKK